MATRIREKAAAIAKKKDNRPECVKNAVKKAQRLVGRIFEDEMIFMLKDFDNRKEGLEYILNTFTELRDNARAVFAQLMVQKSTDGIDDLPFPSLIENTNYFSTLSYEWEGLVIDTKRKIREIDGPKKRKRKVRDYEAEDREYEASLKK